MPNGYGSPSLLLAIDVLPAVRAATCQRLQQRDPPVDGVPSLNEQRQGRKNLIYRFDAFWIIKHE